jgi:hypothetical protein
MKADVTVKYIYASADRFTFALMNKDATPCRKWLLICPIPLSFSLDDPRNASPMPSSNDGGPQRKRSVGHTAVFRVDSGQGNTSEIGPSSPGVPVEYFFASDASAIIEHTNKVIYLEDDDVASVKNGSLSIHRVKSDGNVDR